MTKLGEYQKQKTSKLKAEEKERLVRQYVPLVKIMAYRLVSRLPSSHFVDDLISCGNIGLLEAIESYNPQLAIKFETFAKFRIRGAMLDEMRQRDWIPRSVRSKIREMESAYQKLATQLSRTPSDEEMAKFLHLSLDEYHDLLMQTQPAGLVSLDYLLGDDQSDSRALLDFLEDRRTVDPDLEVQLKELKEKIVTSLEKLEEDEQMLMALYYYESLTFKEIAEVLKVTESRVSQVHAKALMKLQGKLRNIKKDADEIHDSISRKKD